MHVHVVRVFVDENGGHGNPLGIVLDPLRQDAEARLAATQRLGFAETVFVDDSVTARVEIYSAAGPLPFAGHPLVGTGWLLKQLVSEQLSVLRPPSGDIPFWIEGDIAWIAGDVKACPRWTHQQLDSVDEIESMRGPIDPLHDAVQYWAWADEAAGLIRARVFGARFGILEDEACGSASMMLASRLDRSIQIQHGLGSRIFAKPGVASGQAAVGGRVARDPSISLE